MLVLLKSRAMLRGVGHHSSSLVGKSFDWRVMAAYFPSPNPFVRPFVLAVRRITGDIQEFTFFLARGTLVRRLGRLQFVSALAALPFTHGSLSRWWQPDQKPISVRLPVIREQVRPVTAAGRWKFLRAESPRIRPLFSTVREDYNTRGH